MKNGIGRLEYFGLLFGGGAILTGIMVFMLSDESRIEYVGVLNLLYFIYSLLPITLRLKNLGRPAWHALGALIPLYNIYLGLVLLFKKGSDGIRI